MSMVKNKGPSKICKKFHQIHKNMNIFCVDHCIKLKFWGYIPNQMAVAIAKLNVILRCQKVATLISLFSHIYSMQAAMTFLAG